MADDTIDVTAQLEAVEKGVKDFQAKAKAFEEKAQSTEKEIAELKGLKDSFLKVDQELKAAKDEIKVIKDAADKNQPVIDDMVGRRKDIHFGAGEPVTVEQALVKALENHTDDIAKMVSKDPGRKKEWSMNLDLKAVGDMSISNYTGGTRGLTALRPGIITPPNRKLHVRDIVPVGTIGPGTEYVFMKENGDGEGAITAVAEGATKPQIDLDLVEASVKIETIAGWLRVTRKAMNNIQGFTSWIQSRLPEKLLRVEDNLLLNGDGVSPNIKGIQVAGNFTAASGAATVDIEQLVQAISQLEELEREATGIVVRPSDYYNMLLNKAAGSGEYDTPNIVTVDANGVMRILGIPVVATTAQTVDKFLVGDFRMGAQLLIQEGIRVEFFEQDGDNVRTNKITIRIEETVAFPVFGSDFFIFGDFGNVA
jgi:HK97 family phage major capsid protein